MYFADDSIASLRDIWRNFKVLDNEDMNVYITKTLLKENKVLPAQLFLSDMDVSNSSLDEMDLEISRLYLWRTNPEKYDMLPWGPLEHLKFAQSDRIFMKDSHSSKIDPMGKDISIPLVLCGTSTAPLSVTNHISLQSRKKRGRPSKATAILPIDPPVASCSTNAISELCTSTISRSEQSQVVAVGHTKLENCLPNTELTDSLDRDIVSNDDKHLEESSHTVERVDLRNLCATADDEWDMLFDFQIEYRTRGDIHMSGKDLLDSLGLTEKLTYCLSTRKRISNREGSNEYSLRKKLRELFEKDQNELILAQNMLILSTTTTTPVVSTARDCKSFLDVLIFPFSFKSTRTYVILMTRYLLL